MLRILPVEEMPMDRRHFSADPRVANRSDDAGGFAANIGNDVSLAHLEAKAAGS